jgi:hypothetical protein
MHWRATHIAQQSLLSQRDHASFSESRGGHNRQHGLTLRKSHDYRKCLLPNDGNCGRPLFFIGMRAHGVNILQEYLEILGLAHGEG